MGRQGLLLLFMNRESAMKCLKADEKAFDVLIVGGGASGLGAAVDAAARGHTVALIEQSDFAKGTSSRSTKLVHGGVRYLKQGNISLVRSALHERGLLLRNASHLVRAQPFVVPCYSWWERSYYAFGMGLYDRLAGSLSFGRSQRLSREETLGLLPTLETSGLRGGVLYYDGQFDDARLAIDLAQTAAEKGAILANYCSCVGLLKDGGRVRGALARDNETGQEFRIRARVVINAAGVFVDELRRQDEAEAAPLVVASQGIHVVLPREFMPGSGALMVPKTQDGRVLFAIPWHDKVVVGTTDTPGVTPALEPRALPEEFSFVMGHARKYLAKDPGDDDVLSVFAGLRPLVRHGVGTRTSALSRDHTIVVSNSGLVTLTGGKWTTYRKMAEDVVNHAEQVTGLVRRPCATRTLRLHGAGEGGTPAPAGLESYGSAAAEIAALGRATPLLDARVHSALPLRKAEVLWQVRHEMARTVEDVLARRTRFLMLDARASVAAAPSVARLLASELGRDAAWEVSQVDAYARLASGWLPSGVTLSAPLFAAETGARDPR